MTAPTAPALLNEARAEQMMRELWLDALVATTPENVTHASEFWSLSRPVEHTLSDEAGQQASNGALHDDAGVRSFHLLSHGGATAEVW